MKRMFWIGLALLQLGGCKPTHRYWFKDVVFDIQKDGDYQHGSKYYRDGEPIGGAWGEESGGVKFDDSYCDTNNSVVDHSVRGRLASYADAELWLEENCK